VDEGAATTIIRIQAGSADELGIAGLDALDSIEDKLHVGKVDLAVPIQIGLLPVSDLVDEDVCGVAELVATVASATLTANGLVMRRRAEA
jgi:hypothetical protein